MDGKEEKAHLTRIAEEREILEDLRRKFSHSSMKIAVDSALSDLDEAQIALDTDSMSIAEAALSFAVSKRKQLQQNFADYGADAELT